MVKGSETWTIVIYDIESDRTRVRVANICKDYGLEHIQYSAFRGPLNSTKRNELFTRLADQLGKQPGRILVVPVCEADVELTREIDNTLSTFPD